MKLQKKEIVSDLLKVAYDSLIIASLIPQFVGPPKNSRDPSFRYHKHTKFGRTYGVLKSYKESGFMIEAKNPKDRAEKFRSKKNVNQRFKLQKVDH